MTKEHLDALRELVDIVYDETMGSTATDDPDDESVGWNGEGPLPMTFGHIRRARNAIAALSAEPPALRDAILELATKDRETTLHNVFAALEELQAIRPAVAGIAYDPMLIGAHADAKMKCAAALMGMLAESGAIEYAQQRTISGAAAMQATLMVVLPVGVTVEPADQETRN